MRRTLVWLLLMCKRLLKRPSFLIILLLLPVVLLSYRYLISEDTKTLKVGIYMENEEDEFAQLIVSELLEDNDFIEFYECDTEEDVYADVTAGRAECGYVVSEGMLEKLMAKRFTGLITLAVSENSRYADYINERVYAAIYMNLTDDLTISYLEENNATLSAANADIKPMTTEEIRALVEERYESSIKTGNIFTFQYWDWETGEFLGEASEIEETSDHNFLTKPIRGTVALFVLLAGLAGLVFWYQDEKEGRFQAFAFYKRPWLNLGSLLLPTLLGGITALVCLLVSGIGQNVFVEIAYMLLYCLLVTGFCNLLRMLIPSVNAVCAMIPILTITSYLCTPILFDLTSSIPAISYVRQILVVDYYLEACLHASLALRLVLASLCLLPVTVLVDSYLSKKIK